jgi:branched-chain amino acid transport system ATP-binding protein
MRRGRVVYDGDCAKLRQSPDELHRLYLGEAESAVPA